MEKTRIIEQFKGQTRLPKFATPKRYDLHVVPDLSACTFSGSVQIGLNIIEKTKFLVLNSLELVINEASFITSQSQEYHPCDVVLDIDDEILVFVFAEDLGVGEGVLKIEFSGVLNAKLKGFYRCSYTDGGVKKNMAVTQFEAVDARRCFPCWDEPALKATFKIILTVPSELTALSNMPVISEEFKGNLKIVYFEESPLMSTYLVAFLVGVFDYIEEKTSDGIKVRVYCAVGKSDQGKFALDVAAKSIDIYTNYFAMPYQLPKLDLVAVPEFAAGAMENYGLIVYRENELLHNDLHSTAAKKQINTIATTHEVAHQWFGNLVTMEWWTHLWLNEGFATWVSYMATSKLFPEWNIWNQFLLQSADGLQMDALASSHPIEVDLPHARAIEEAFDAISYKKGSALIRMLQGYLGNKIFQKSLSSYIRRYAGKNAKTEDLWTVLDEESGVPVNSLMNSWTTKTGFPVLSVSLKDHVLELKQSQFQLSSCPNDELWIVPISLAIGSYKYRRNFLLTESWGKVDVSDLVQEVKDKENCDDIWIKVNIGQSGFYRVNYEETLENSLRKAVEENHLSTTDKFGILDDTYALCLACMKSLSSLLSMIHVYRKELDYIILSKVISVCYNVLKVAADAIPDSVNDLKQIFINLLLFSREKLGWDSVPGDNHLTALLRGEVLLALVNFGHEETQQEALRRFRASLDNGNTSLLSADTRRAAYVSVMRNVNSENRTGLESLLNLYRKADLVQEKEMILRCITSSPDPQIVHEVLNFLTSDEVRDQDIIYGLANISFEAREIAWRWLKENWEKILDKFSAVLLLTHFITNFVIPFSSNRKADEIEAFFANCTTQSIAMNLKLSIEQIRIKARWIESIRQDHSVGDLIKQLAHSIL